MTLVEREQRLARERAVAQWNLGGLTYEMAIRDHFRLDLLLRHAARLQELDAELAEVVRLRYTEMTGEAGACPSCAAPHSHGAGYCWKCGTPLLARQDVRA